MGFVGTSILAQEGAVTAEIYNITVAAADTEQSQVLPAVVVGYMIRTRGNSELKLSHVAAESGTKYVTIPKSATHTDEHTYNDLILYFQSPIMGDVVEIKVWSL